MGQINMQEVAINKHANYLWSEYQSGRLDENHTCREYFIQVVSPLIRKISELEETASSTSTNTPKVQICPGCKGVGTSCKIVHGVYVGVMCKPCKGTGKL